MDLIVILIGAIDSSIDTLIDYLSLHVILCLIPAFFIAGAMSYFIPKEVIIKYIGKDADPKVAYPMATIGGFLLAVCSCTVLPLFVSIWKRGAGLGPAITFLFVAPAINILAVTYTGTLIGLDIALARATLAIAFAILIGIIMSRVFTDDRVEITADIKEKSPNTTNKDVNDTNENIKLIGLLSTLLVVFSILLAILNAEIIKGIGLLISQSSNPLFEKPYLLQTIIFFLGLTIIIIASFKIMNKIIVLFFWLIYILMTGTSQISFFDSAINVLNIDISPDITNMLVKLVLSLIVTGGLVVYLSKHFDRDDIDIWLHETYTFVKSILPLIIVGVIIAGFIKFFIPPELVVSLVGRNTVLANLLGVLFGVFMYFPTLMEVPIAKMFLELGMSKGVLLAYLLADPELSIQSILVTRKFLGDKKNLAYVILVTVFTTIAGLIFGLMLGLGIALW